ncbi:conserved hypothetical protein [Theileria equi strain WA]|uniref:ERCC4 domain-containing protein n=1 Tax=Theileria equi strain WA TaxID=1537102 RepID=L1LF42_THEEQ|nr:conserved hypothetical protein [Theileria equi strain WA]EKX73904.1 conserved hypothetical protein [Theileria equi strain WA]|eukprot:XP_004833356.1 conserved hypothetical protein [Theileria equi strain WA]
MRISVNVDDDEYSSKRLRIGIWPSRSFKMFDEIIPELQSHKGSMETNVEVYRDNRDEFLSDDLFALVAHSDNVCLLGTNYNYQTHLDKAMMRKSKDTSDDESFTDEKCFKASTLLVIVSKEDLNRIELKDLQSHIISIIEPFKAFQANLKCILIMHGLRDYALHGNMLRNKNGEIKVKDSHLLHTSMLNELTCHLLIHYDVDTVETDDAIDLARFIMSSCSSIELCLSRKSALNFKSKPHESLKEELPPMKKTWLTQLLQIPEVGKDTAKSIANVYNGPSEIIKSVINSHDKCLTTMKNISLNSKTRRKIGASLAKRVTLLYSYNLVPDDRVF